MWAVATGRLMRPRWRTLAVASALQATAAAASAGRGRRASAAASGEPGADDPANAGLALGATRRPNWPTCCRPHATWSCSAQSRAPPTHWPPVLVHTIELRDMLLAVRLDLDLIGRDTPGRQTMTEMADPWAVWQSSCRKPPARCGSAGPALQLLGRARGRARPATHARQQRGLARATPVRVWCCAAAAAASAGPWRATGAGRPAGPAAPGGAVGRATAPLRCAQRLAVVGTEGPVHPGHSPVLRHALRTGLAFGCAYALAQALPLDSPPALAGAECGGGAARQPRANLGAAQPAGGRHAAGLPAGGGPGPPSRNAVAGGGVLAGGGHGPCLCTAALLADRYRRHGDGAAAGPPDAPGRWPCGGRTCGRHPVLGAALAWLFSYVLPAWNGANCRAWSIRRDGHYRTMRWRCWAHRA